MIEILGPLREHPDVPEWRVSEPVEIPYFNGKKLAFCLDHPELCDDQDAEHAIIAFLKLGPADRLAASPYVFANYREMAQLLSRDELDCAIDSEEDVWAHVHPHDIFVSKRQGRDSTIYIQITAGCDWEQEHGLQIIYKRGLELSRVSAQDGHLTYTDAYDLPEDQDKIVG